MFSAVGKDLKIHSCQRNIDESSYDTRNNKLEGGLSRRSLSNIVGVGLLACIGSLPIIISTGMHFSEYLLTPYAYNEINGGKITLSELEQYKNSRNKYMNRLLIWSGLFAGGFVSLSSASVALDSRKSKTNFSEEEKNDKWLNRSSPTS